MLEEAMSVWPDTVARASSLVSSEGALVLVTIPVQPRLLESLLDTLAEVDFPVNPQIYHDGAIVYLLADGSERTEPATLVEFPAYASRLPGLRLALARRGFNPDDIEALGVLDDVYSGRQAEPAPAGAGYRSHRRLKVAGLVRSTPLQ
jgi:hypothetical protein